MGKIDSDNIISARAADLLISLRDGDAALLYLYFCRHGFREPERAARELYLPRQRLQEACERLEMQGLLVSAGEDGLAPGTAGQSLEDRPTGSATAGLPADGGDFPAFTAAEIRERSDCDSAFSSLLAEAKLILGRPLSTPDLNKMLGMYDHLGLPAEVMMMLMHFVADQYRERYQEQRRPTVGAFEREARVWAAREIRDFDGAEQYINRWQERHSMEGELKDALQIVGRDFTETERRYIEQWLDWGFGPEVIACAYDLTVTKTRKFVPSYMDKVLRSWHEKGLHTLQEIREKDRPPRPGRVGSAPGGTSPGGFAPIDPEQIANIEKLMNGGKKVQNRDT